MNASRVAGIVAIVSGLALLVAVLVGTVLEATDANASNATGTGPFGMMGGSSGMMGGYGPGAMMGPGMMGSGHMGFVTGDGSSAGGPIAGASEVKVTAADLSFTPSEITLPANAAVNLTLTNTGAVIHDLTIPALGVRVVANPGETRSVGLRGLPAGTYQGYCSVPGHAQAGMRVSVVVR